MRRILLITLALMLAASWCLYAGGGAEGSTATARQTPLRLLTVGDSAAKALGE